MDGCRIQRTVSWSFFSLMLLWTDRNEGNKDRMRTFNVPSMRESGEPHFKNPLDGHGFPRRDLCVYADDYDHPLEVYPSTQSRALNSSHINKLGTCETT